MTVRSHSQVSALVIGVIIGLVAGVLLTVVAFRLLPSPQMVSQPEPLLEAPSGQPCRRFRRGRGATQTTVGIINMAFTPTH
jgi:hypothetical protein